MASYARKEIIRPNQVAVYHCWATTLPKMVLCGKKGKKDYDHRKEWIRARLVQMSEVFAVEVCGYSINKDRLDVVIRVRPDVAKKWSKEEVARRWKMIHPQDRDRELEFETVKPSKQQTQELLADKGQLEECRKRLFDVTWFVRDLCEAVARRMNREEGRKGRVWYGRFRTRQILDAPAALAACVALEASPVLSGCTGDIAQGGYSSACDRIAGVKARAKAKARAPRSNDPDAWLNPLDAGKPRGKTPAKSAFPMNPSDYVQVVEWTGKQFAAKKMDAAPPADVAAAIKKMGLDPENWLEFVANLNERFTRAVGSPALMAKEAKRIGKSWFRGHIHAEEAYL